MLSACARRYFLSFGVWGFPSYPAHLHSRPVQSDELHTFNVILHLSCELFDDDWIVFAVGGADWTARHVHCFSLISSVLSQMFWDKTLDISHSVAKENAGQNSRWYGNSSQLI